MQQPTTSACVGREPELTTLSELYDQARQGAERLVWLEGPSGVGKSRILQEFRSRVRLDGGIVLDGRCQPGRAFGPFEELVDQALRFLSEIGHEPTVTLSHLACHDGCHALWHQHAAGANDLMSEGTESLRAKSNTSAYEKRLRFFGAVRGLLRDVSKVRAPVILLHDLERTDHGTIELLQFLLDGSPLHALDIDRGAPMRALFVATTRSDDPRFEPLLTHPSSTRVEVRALDAEGVRAMLQSPEIVSRVLARTGGMPEAIDLLLDAEPPTPEERLRRKLATHPIAVRALFEALSVLDRPTDIDALAAIANTHVDALARQDFGRSELLHRSIENGTLLFAFARSTDRERMIAMMPKARQDSLHARAMENFRARGDELSAARHAIAAHQIEHAVPLAITAAATLAARHAHAEASELLEQVAASISGPIPVELATRLVELHRVTGRYAEALKYAARLVSADPENAHSALILGETQMLAGEYALAVATLEKAHHLSNDAGETMLTVEVEALLGELHYQKSAHDEAKDWSEKALRLADILGVLPIAIEARNTLGKVALALCHDTHKAFDLFEQNRALAESAGLGHFHAQALTNLGVVKLRVHDLSAAETFFEKAVEVATAASDTRDRAIATENLAVLAHMRRDYATALQRYHEATTLLQQLGHRAMLARVSVNLGELYLSMGEKGRARTLCELAAQIGGAQLPDTVAAEALLLRGRVEAAFGHQGAAAAALEGARARLEARDISTAFEAQFELATLALADGDVAAARRIVDVMTPIENAGREASKEMLLSDIARAEGEDAAPHAERAAFLADTIADDEKRLSASLRLARVRFDRRDSFGATQAVELAREANERLTDRVPEEHLASWNERPDAQKLNELSAMIVSAFSRDARASVRPSAPPGSRSTRPGASSEITRKRFASIVGESPVVAHVISVLDRVSPSDCTVLIGGESGTGKELVAEALHRNSPRRDKPFVKVNCAALVETLLMSELFGHERGAYTGANARKKGRFELADGGTLFLDEIGDISPKTQVALLRVLQEREFERVGGTQTVKVDVRIICATHRDLEKMVRRGEFREDLYYRLRGVTIDMPALRNRLEDLPILSASLLDRIANERSEASRRLSPESIRLLAAHRWPGNVRELENVLRSATLFADGPILEPRDFAAFSETFQHLEPEPELAIHDTAAAAAPDGVDEIELAYRKIRHGDISLLEMKKELERACIARALDETHGNITKAASLLGMKRPRLSQLVKEFGLAAVGEG